MWAGLYANLHNFKTCITFDFVGILRYGFQHFGCLIIVIEIMKSFKNLSHGLVYALPGLCWPIIKKFAPAF